MVWLGSTEENYDESAPLFDSSILIIAWKKGVTVDRELYFRTYKMPITLAKFGEKTDFL